MQTGETDALNLHISRQFGKLLLAAEYTSLDTSETLSTLLPIAKMTVT